MNLTNMILALFLAVGLSLAIGLVVFELIFGGWLRTPDGWRALEQLNVIRDRTIKYDVERIYGEGAPPVHYSRDQFGLRDSCSNPAQISIVTVGGSTTDQRYISDGETWQDVLQQELRKHTGDETLCVSNAGVDGHSTYGHIATLDSWFPLIPGFRPNTYLLFVGINDAGFREGPNVGFDIVDSTSWKSKSVLWRIARTVNQALESQRGPDRDRSYAGHSRVDVTQDLYTEASATPGTAPLIEANTVEFRVNMGRLLESIRDANDTPVCISQPHQFVRTMNGERRGAERVFSHNGTLFNGIDYDDSLKALNRVLQDMCPAYGGRYIDLTDVPFRPNDYYDWVHMTPKGAQGLGVSLAEKLVADASRSSSS